MAIDNKTTHPETADSMESENRITQRGKTPKEIQADLLSGESDDLTVDFTNIINYGKGGSN
jgi:hypothetical protein